MSEEVEFRAHVNDRVIRLEEVLNASNGTVARINSDLGSLAEDFTYFVDSMNQYIATASKTNWATLAAWASFILMMVAMPGAWLTSNLIRLEDSYDEVFTQYVIPDGNRLTELETTIRDMRTHVKSLEEAFSHLPKP